MSFTFNRSKSFAYKLNSMTLLRIFIENMAFKKNGIFCFSPAHTMIASVVCSKDVMKRCCSKKKLDIFKQTFEASSLVFMGTSSDI